MRTIQPLRPLPDLILTNKSHTKQPVIAANV